jgi:hypothetical protein
MIILKSDKELAPSLQFPEKQSIELHRKSADWDKLLGCVLPFSTNWKDRHLSLLKTRNY